MAEKANPKNNVAADTTNKIQPVGKGAPTPTRAEREAARIRPLVPDDRRAAAKASREERAALRERARVGMAAGDERYLPMRDRGSQKRFIRDCVDGRFNLGEVMIPILFILILMTWIPDLTFQAVTIGILWLFLLASIVDAVFLTRRIRRALNNKFGHADKIGLYAATRALQLRFLRLPKPQVKRGQFPF